MVNVPSDLLVLWVVERWVNAEPDCMDSNPWMRKVILVKRHLVIIQQGYEKCGGLVNGENSSDGGYQVACHACWGFLPLTFAYDEGVVEVRIWVWPPGHCFNVRLEGEKLR